jgi:CelD/BcsL family acetyltransferase involved in cellulose biosynthesis
MQVTCVKPRELSGRQIDSWSRLQRENAAFDSPFLRPEFSHLVGNVRPGVEVAVMERAGRPAGFWAFERCPRNIARPVGLSLCGLQGVVAEPALDWSPEDLVEQCGLTAWPFSDVIAAQAPLRRFHWYSYHSPVIDLRSGFHEYCRQKRAEGSRTVEQAFQKIRKIQREVGPIRFVPAVTIAACWQR